MKFRQKEHIIEAVQWSGSNRAEISALTGLPEKELFYYKQLQIHHCGELVVVKPGDYVAKMDDGTIMLYSREHMEEYYEPVAEDKILITTPPRAGKRSRLESMFGPKESWDPGAKRDEEPKGEPVEEAAVGDEAKASEKPRPKKGYLGFLHLRCDSCGKTKSMCAKRPMKEYRCGSCGHETKLKNLKQVEFTCGSCGTEFTYQTNQTSLGFTMECLSCKSPVDLVYSQREKKYRGGADA